MKTITFVTLILLIIISCKKEATLNQEKLKSIQTKDGFKVVLLDSITFKIADTDVNTSIRSQYIPYSNTLVKDDKINNKIVFYDWDTKKKRKELLFTNTGKDAIRSKAGFFVDNDVIWVNDYDYYRLVKVDTSGVVTNIYNFYEAEGRNFEKLRESGICKLLLRNSKQAFRVKDDIYFYGSYSDGFSLKGLEEGFTIIKFNTITKKEKLILKLPKEYYSTGNYGRTIYHATSFTILNEKIYMSYGGLPDIYTYDLDGNLLDKKPMYSLKHENPQPNPKLDFESEEPDDQLGTYYVYSMFFYDPSSKLFYRILEHPKDNPEINIRYDPYFLNFTILIYDQDLNYLDEVDLSYKNYLISDAFIGPRGLYISTSSNANPNLDESKMTYHCFGIVPSK
jgi:hypothetical protein